MPAFVDHNQRRRDIAAAVETIVARSGIQNVTIREVAKQTGYSPTVVTHYFDSKLELMTFTYVEARLRAIARVEASLQQGGHYIDCLAECLPVDETRQTEWKVWFGYWGMAEENPELDKERQLGVAASHDLFTKVLAEAQRQGEIRTEVDLNRQATRVQIFINGLACLALQVPGDWPAERLQKMFRDEMAGLRSE